MTQEFSNEQIGEADQRRSRGPAKPFPQITFEDAVTLPKSILEHGFDGEILRLTLLRELQFPPGSSKTRDWISGSHKYGLTEGSYNATSLTVTEAGRVIAGMDYSRRETREWGFQLAINQFAPFKTLYEKLKNSRLRDARVIQDELERVGISSEDGEQAAAVFTGNLRFLGLVQDVTGQEYVRSIEQALEDIPTETDGNPQELPIIEPAVETATPVTASVGESKKVAVESKRPALHIDIQVHIDPTSSAEQIDQIFASMAKHLYGNDS